MSGSVSDAIKDPVKDEISRRLFGSPEKVPGPENWFKDLIATINGNPRAYVQCSELLAKVDCNDRHGFVRGLQWIVTGVAEFKAAVTKKPEIPETVTAQVKALEVLIRPPETKAKIAELTPPVNGEENGSTGDNPPTDSATTNGDNPEGVSPPKADRTPTFSGLLALTSGIASCSNAVGIRNHSAAISTGQKHFRNLAVRTRPKLRPIPEVTPPKDA